MYQLNNFSNLKFAVREKHLDKRYIKEKLNTSPIFTNALWIACPEYSVFWFLFILQKLTHLQVLSLLICYDNAIV